MHVESDHQPLETITQKPLHIAPKWLQCMLLQLQKYSLDVQYKKGKHMLLADTLSQAYVSHVCTCSEVKELEEVNNILTIALTPNDILHLQYAAEQDQVMQELHQVILCGWPSSKAELPYAARPYFDFRDQLIVQDQVTFKKPVVVIPAALRAEMMSKCHA